MKETGNKREVIFEFVPFGSFIRVNAVDVQTMIEIVIQGPKNTSEETLKSVALKKLEYVLKKRGVVKE